MKINKILIILGEPQSTFSEILFKYFSSRNFKKNNKKILLIGNIDLINKQMKSLKYKFSLNEVLESMDMIAEGVTTSKTINDLSAKYKVDMPISSAVNQVLFNDVDPKKFVLDLMSRNLINERDN